MSIQDFIDKWSVDRDKEYFVDDFKSVQQECFEAPILYFRGKLSHLYKTQPYNDEGNRCCPSTIYEVISEYDKFFNITNLRKGLLDGK